MSSNNNANLVPILDGTNYAQWAIVMKAFIQSQGLWAYVDGDITRPEYPPTKEEREVMTDKEIEELCKMQALFNKEDGVPLSHLILRTSPTIQQNLQGTHTSCDIWQVLKKAYRQLLAPTVFKDFKECLGVHISMNHDPTVYFDKLYAAFRHMQSAGVGIPKQLQAMIALAALPQKWKMLVSIVTGDIDLKNLDLMDVHNTVLR